MNRTHFFRISFLIDDNHTAKIKENPYISRYLEAVLNLSCDDLG